MQKKDRYFHFISYFSENMPDPETELKHMNPFQLLVAVILSAQCTDQRVNQVTPPLFKRFKTPKDLAEASFEELFPYIKSISYPNNKTRNLISMARMLVDKFDSKIPETIEELQSLPGVGRKTANVMAAVVYHQPAMPVDTHVFRVSRRIGLASATSRTPLAVEKELTKNIPLQKIPDAHHWLILHGRYICKARKPLCHNCGIKSICRYYKKNLPGS